MKNKSKKFYDEELERRRAFRQICAKRNGYDPNYCSSMVKRFSKEEIAEYEKSISKQD
jgi:hypothetical protein